MGEKRRRNRGCNPERHGGRDPAAERYAGRDPAAERRRHLTRESVPRAERRCGQHIRGRIAAGVYGRPW